MAEYRGLVRTCITAGFIAYSVGCATNSPDRSDDIHDSVFVYDRADLETAINTCKQAPTKECRNNMAYIVKAHVDAASVAKPKDRKLLDKAFSLLVIGGTVGATRSSESGKDDIAAALILVSGIRSVFDIGEDDDGDLHSSDVWEKIVARMNLPLTQYPLEAVLADLDEYREVASTE